MNKISFVKMHGLGNDFVFILRDDLPQGANINDFARLISDRKLGVGCDQFIVYAYKATDVIEMKIFNQDGSAALACGNASRCLSSLIYQQTGKKNITLNVDGRQVLCVYESDNAINVDMGAVSFDAPWMPKAEKLWDIAQRYSIEPKEMICVDVANPHLVIFTKLSDIDQVIIGETMQEIEVFQDGINVNFVQIENGEINLKVWERGAGFTLACGSGAIASFAAANKLGYATNSARVNFELGSLKMLKQDESIIMNGPATTLFKGEFHYE